MKSEILALSCTGDPLLDMMLQQCTAFHLAEEVGEKAADAVRLIAEHRPAFVFVSASTGDLSPMVAQAGARVVWLAEAGAETVPAGAGVEPCAGESLTPEVIDGWVRSRSGSGQAGRPAARSAKAPPSNKPTAGFKAPPPPPPQPEPAPEPRQEIQAAGMMHRLANNVPQLTERPRPQQISLLRQRIVALWGGKPGAGRTTLAAGLSDLLSGLPGVKVCTVDLNPYNSSLATLVGKDQERPSWFDLAEGLDRGCPSVVDALRWVRPNWAILTGISRRAEWLELLNAAMTQWLVDELRGRFDYILLDLAAQPGPVGDVALRMAQTVLVVVSPDYPDVLDTHAALEDAVARRLIEKERCRLILNRWVETSALPASVVAQYLGLPVSGRIPAGAEAVVAASAQGLPVTRLETPAARPVAGAMGQAVGLIAEALGEPESGRGLLGLFHRR